MAWGQAANRPGGSTLASPHDSDAHVQNEDHISLISSCICLIFLDFMLLEAGAVLHQVHVHHPVKQSPDFARGL